MNQEKNHEESISAFNEPECEEEFIFANEERLGGSEEQVCINDESAAGMIPQHKTSKSADEIFSALLAKKEKKKKERKEKKKDKKKKVSGNEHNDMETVLYSNDIYGSFNYGITPFSERLPTSEQIRFNQGRNIDEDFQLKLHEDSGVFFGGGECPGEFIGKPSWKDGHICVSGESGRGKTEGIVKPTIIAYQNGSKIIFDCKDNLYKHYIEARNDRKKKYKVFWPDSPDINASCRYDPFGSMRRKGEGNIVEEASALARALILPSENAREPIWQEAAVNFLTGVIIYYYHLEMDFVETLVAVMMDTVPNIMKEINEDGTDSMAKIFINKLAGVDPKVISNIGMEISNLACFVSDEKIMDVLSPEKGCELLDWHEISTSTEPIDVILIIPEEKIDYYKRMLRLMIGQMITTFEQRPRRTFNEKELPPILVLLDEFARLGKIPEIIDGLMTLRSAGVTFVLFVQSIASLDVIYGRDTARVILDNCTYKVILGASDVASQQYFSELVGKVKTYQRNISENYNPINNSVMGYSKSVNETMEPIIYPHEFATLNDVVVVASGYGYFRVPKILYCRYKRLFLQPQLSQNPEYVQKSSEDFLLGWSYR